MYFTLWFNFYLVAFSTVNSSMYYYTHVMKRLFTETRFDTENRRQIQFKDINKIKDVWFVSRLHLYLNFSN